MSLRLILFFVLVVLLSFPACIKEELPSELGPEENNQVIKSPCNYDDWAVVQARPGMSGTVTIVRKKSADFDDILLEFSSSDDKIRIRYDGANGFDNIKSQEVDFAPGVFGKINMDVLPYGSSNVWEAISGKLYIVVQPDGSIKMDWCNVKLRDKWFSLYDYTMGGCLLKF